MTARGASRGRRTGSLAGKHRKPVTPRYHEGPAIPRGLCSWLRHGLAVSRVNRGELRELKDIDTERVMNPCAAAPTRARPVGR